ncbi:MAG: hypothetical protein P8N30_10215 [Tateyamaria sp.]|nr:hypothetical protein [Tateyamaria sp.]
MHIPMTCEEIAVFLECETKEIQDLWDNGKLLKTQSCPYRKTNAQNQSTIYDVLEYTLSSSDLPVQLSREEAALWIFTLAEADEWDEYLKMTMHQKVEALMHLTDELTFIKNDQNSAKVSFTILIAQKVLSDICSETDRHETEYSNGFVNCTFLFHPE